MQKEVHYIWKIRKRWFLYYKKRRTKTEIPKRKIKKHLKAENFKKLPNDILEKYAQAFDLSVEELTDIKRISGITPEQEIKNKTGKEIWK